MGKEGAYSAGYGNLGVIIALRIFFRRPFQAAHLTRVISRRFFNLSYILYISVCCATLVVSKFHHVISKGGVSTMPT